MRKLLDIPAASVGVAMALPRGLKFVFLKHLNSKKHYMIRDNKAVCRKLSLLELAKDLGNVSEACKVMECSCQLFYEISRSFRPSVLSDFSTGWPYFADWIPTFAGMTGLVPTLHTPIQLHLPEQKEATHFREPPSIPPDA